MSNKFNIAVVGATGNVGREILQILEQREFPIDNIYLLASLRSKGKKIEFKEKEVVVEDLADFDFSKVQIGLFSPGGTVSESRASCIVVSLIESPSLS